MFSYCQDEALPCKRSKHSHKWLRFYVLFHLKYKAWQGLRLGQTWHSDASVIPHGPTPPSPCHADFVFSVDWQAGCRTAGKGMQSCPLLGLTAIQTCMKTWCGMCRRNERGGAQSREWGVPERDIPTGAKERGRCRFWFCMGAAGSLDWTQGSSLALCMSWEEQDTSKAVLLNSAYFWA